MSRIAHLQDFRTRLLNEQVALNGKVCLLQQQAASISAAGAAAHHYIRILLLAGQPSGLAIVPARGRFRAQFRVHRAGKLSGAVHAARILQGHADDAGVLVAGRGAVAVDRAVVCDPGRQEP